MSILSFIGDMFQGLLNVFFFGPASNLDVLYVLVPVYLNWVVNDYYQERRGTDLGNAAANGFTAIWVGIDWVRTMVPRASGVKFLSFSWYLMSLKFLVAALVLFYGVTIMRYAVSGNQIAKKIGRIREVSYVCIVFTPFVYDLVKTSEPSFSALMPTFLGVALFFPVFYYAAEVILNSLPAPATELDGMEPPAQRPQRPVSPPAGSPASHPKGSPVQQPQSASPSSTPAAPRTASSPVQHPQSPQPPRPAPPASRPAVPRPAPRRPGAPQNAAQRPKEGGG